MQFFALDKPEANVDEPLPIVVAVGVNYTQGDTEVPRDTRPNAVEDQLKNCRMNATKALRHFAGNTALWRRAGHVSDALAAVDPERSHFVMTNISPWITTASWQDDTIPDSARSALWEDGLARRTIARLERALRPHVPTWIAHGIHTALFSNWTGIARDHGIGSWLRTGNLSYFYNYQYWPLLRLTGESAQ